MQRDVADFMDRCTKLSSPFNEGGLGGPKGALRRFSDLLSSVHSHCGARLPPSLALVILSHALPALRGSSAVETRAARLAYVLADMAADAATEDDARALVRALVRGEEVVRGHGERRVRALRLCAAGMEKGGAEEVGEEVAKKLAEEVREWGGEGEGEGEGEERKVVKRQGKRLKGMMRKRRGAEDGKVKGKGKEMVKEKEKEREVEMVCAVVDVVRRAGGERGKGDVVSEWMSGENQAMARETARYVLGVVGRSKGEAREVIECVGKIIPHRKGEASQERKVNLASPALKCLWVKVCVAAVNSSLCSDKLKAEFYVSVALLLRDSSEITKVAAVCGISLCPWKFCLNQQVPNFPQGEAQEAVLETLFECIEDLIHCGALIGQSGLLNLVKSIQRICQTRELFWKQGQHGLSLETQDNKMWDTFRIIWQDIAHLCYTYTSPILKLECIKALVLLGQNQPTENTSTGPGGLNPAQAQTSTSPKQHSHGSGGRFFAVLKELCLSLSTDHLENVLLVMKGKVETDSSFVPLILDLAFVRFVREPTGIGLEAIFETWSDCLQHSDTEDANRTLVLEEIFALLDSPDLTRWKVEIYVFLHHHLARLAPWSLANENDLPPQGDALVTRLVKGVYLDGWEIRLCCCNLLMALYHIIEPRPGHRLHDIVIALSTDPFQNICQ